MEEIERLREEIEKKNQIYKLIYEIGKPFVFQYFDFESNKNLDKKIEMLERFKVDKSVAETSEFFTILELYPKENEKT